MRPNLAMFNAALRSCQDVNAVKEVRTKMLAMGVKGNGYPDAAVLLFAPVRVCAHARCRKQLQPTLTDAPAPCCSLRITSKPLVRCHHAV